MKATRKSRPEFNNLLVTGGCGFIGSNFIRYLIGNSEFSGRIINVDKLTYAGNPEKLIPLVILNATEEKPLPVYGDGRNVRDWLYVEDHCKAIWTIMKYGNTGETYNIGGSAEIENIIIVQMICDILDEIAPQAWGKSHRKLISFVADRPGHDRRYAIDFTKIKTEIDWSPQELFKSGLGKTVNWYLNQKKWVENIKTGAYQSWIKDQYGS